MRNRGLNQILTAAVEITKAENTKNQLELLEAINSYRKEQEEMVNSLRSEILEVLVDFHQNQQGFMEEDHTGPQGEIGPQGQQGIRGEIGPQGVQGPDGQVGPQGKRGEQGNPFIFEDFTTEHLGLLKGEQGEIGPQGQQGIRGEIGPQGVQGIQGERGFLGLQGVKGDIGEQGIQGEMGLVGPKGEDGLPGERGEKGEIGPRGAPGERGLRGDPGKDFNSQEMYEKVITQVNEMISKLPEPEIEVTSNDLTEIRNEVYKRMGNLESRMVNLISSSSGSGEVLLAKMDDVDTTNIGNQKMLVYDSTTKKFVFQAKTEGTGSIDLGPLDPDDSGTITDAEFTAAVDDAVDDADIDGGTFS